MTAYPSNHSLGTPAVRPPANLPQSTSEPIFEVVGGWVYLTMMFGRVTEAIGAGANLLNGIYDREVSGPLIIGTADKANIESLPVNSLAIMEAETTDTAWIVTQGHFNAWSTVLPDTFFGLGPGIYSINTTGSSTGKMSWHAWWNPLQDGAHLSIIEAP